MLSVHGYYENGVCVPTETLELAGKRQVIITIMDEDNPSKITSKEKRLEVIKALSGILPSSITDEEVKNDFAVEN